MRFFGGWEFEAQDAQNRLPAQIGYTKGVPMGGDLRDAPAGKAPSFLVAALKDPIGANLDRIQIVKGWLDKQGGLQEKVYDVAWSGDRKAGADGKLPPVGISVDAPNATWTNTIGTPELITVWKDPDFDPALRAFYYARVIEIPMSRWTAYDAKRFGITMDPKVPTQVDRCPTAGSERGILSKTPPALHRHHQTSPSNVRHYRAGRGTWRRRGHEAGAVPPPSSSARCAWRIGTRAAPSVSRTAPDPPPHLRRALKSPVTR